jgi:exodeoxyribonuclease V beta subunit
VLQALATVFKDATFGDPDIAFSPVNPGRTDIAGASFPDGSAMQIRLLDHEESAEERHRRTGRDLVAQVVDILRAGRLPHGDGEREVRPSDIGILVRSNDRAARIVEDLAAVGVPAVAMGRSSVLTSPAASQWQMLIGAMQRPSRLSTAKTAAVGWFGSWELDAIAHLGEAEETAMLEWVGTVVDSLATGGVPAMLATLRRMGFAARLLARPGGERDLTDVEHIAELLQIRTGGAPTTPDRLNAIMTELRRAGDAESSGEVFDRRIDRDDDTVKVLTIHKAKGLEFPIVFCPDLWSGKKVTSGLAHAVHPELGIRLIDTSAIHPGNLEDPFQVAATAEAEQRGELTRLMYVAFTRPRHRLVFWAAPGYQPKGNYAMPLADRLHAVTGGDLFRLGELSGATIAVVPVPIDPGRVTPLEITSNHADLEVATIERTFDRSWRVWSYSAIERVAAAATPSAHGTPASPTMAPVAAPDGTATSPATIAPDSEEPEVVGGLDEPPSQDEDSERDASAGTAATTLATVPGGPAFGTAVHALLEDLDFSSPTLESDLVAHSAAALAVRPAPISPTALATGLLDALTTPVGGPLGSFRLVDLNRRDRLDELDFHVPLGRFQASDLAAIVRDGLEPGDTLAPWFEEAARSGHAIALEGYLTGSIDLVARVDDRYFIADYKTNRLDGYDDVAMTRSMIEHAYPLQAVIYLVAVHRHLRSRLTGYDPDVHLMGATYLFLRGMRPDATTGVRWWRPPTRVLVALDELFSTGVTP